MLGKDQLDCSLQPISIRVPRGPLSHDSAFYIDRPPLEELVLAKITQPGSLIRLKAPRYMGKSSLLLRIYEYTTGLHYAYGAVDFLQADISCFEGIDRLLRWFCLMVALQLGLSPNMEEDWDDDIGSKVNATIFFEQHLLQPLDRPFVLSLNEVNRLFRYKAVAEDFLSLLRFWYEQGQRSPLWQKLRLVLAYSTEVYIPLQINQSPFNVGEQFRIPPFTLEQVRTLAQRYGLACQVGDEYEPAMNDLYALTGGHPYFTHMAIAHLSSENCSPQPLFRNMVELTGLLGEDLRRCLTTVQSQPDLVQALKILLQTPTGVQFPSGVTYQLQSLGIVTIDGSQCQFSCELYRRLFERELGDRSSGPFCLVDQLQAENQKLQTLALTDALTGIANRRAFDYQLDQAWRDSIQTQSSLALMLVDIDYFKHYNDTHGHPAGDVCLQAVAGILQQQVRSPRTDFVARYGGEEFAILMRNVEINVAQDRAEQLRTQVKMGTMNSTLAAGVTVSIGVATITPNIDDSQARFVAAADGVLYESKRLGRDRVTVITIP